MRVWYQRVETHVTSMGTPTPPLSPHIHHATTLSSLIFVGQLFKWSEVSVSRVCCPNMHLVYEGGAGTLHTAPLTLSSINIAMGITEMYNPSIDKFLSNIPQFLCRNNTALRGCQKWYWTNRKYQGNLCRQDKKQSSQQQYDGAVILIIRISKYIPAVDSRDSLDIRTLLY